MPTDQMIADALPQLRAGARKLSKTEEDAQDLLQETFLKACKYKRTFRGDCSLPSWLHKVMRSIRFRPARHMDRITNYVEPWLVGEQIASTDVEKQVEVLQVIQRLDRGVKNPLHRAIFHNVLLGVPGEDIARELNVDPKTVRSRTSRIRDFINAVAA